MYYDRLYFEVLYVNHLKGGKKGRHRKNNYLLLTNLLQINGLAARVGSGEDLNEARLLAGHGVVGHKVVARQHVQGMLALPYVYDLFRRHSRAYEVVLF